MRHILRYCDQQVSFDQLVAGFGESTEGDQIAHLGNRPTVAGTNGRCTFEEQNIRVKRVVGIEELSLAIIQQDMGNMLDIVV